MARIRTVKPEFWQDQKMAAELTREQRLFYIALWNEADDEGRFLANPRRLLGLVFPFDEDIHEAFIEASLRALADTKRVTLYQIDGTPYGQLTKFEDHQRINRPTPSRIPPPDSELAEPHGGLSEGSVRAQPLEVGTGEVGSRNRGTEDSTPSPRAREEPDVENSDVENSDPLTAWLGEHAEIVADCPLVRDQSARRSLHLQFGPPGLRAHAWRLPDGSSVEPDERPRLLAAALVGYAGEGNRRVIVNEFAGMLRRTIQDELHEPSPAAVPIDDLWED